MVSRTEVSSVQYKRMRRVMEDVAVAVPGGARALESSDTKTAALVGIYSLL